MRALVISSVFLLSASLSWADGPPPAGSKPASDIIRSIETRPDFRYFKEVEFDDGVYKVEYVTQDNARKKIRIDPISGNQR